MAFIFAFKYNLSHMGNTKNITYGADETIDIIKFRHTILLKYGRLSHIFINKEELYVKYDSIKA